MSIPVLSLALVMAGLMGLGGLALMMGTALSSLAELLALLLRTDGWIGSCPAIRGPSIL